MEYRQLGRTGLRVGPLALGTVNFSSYTNEADSFAIMDRALELGINHFDTANNYNAGRSEALIGRWLAQGGGRREKVVLATKVYCKPNVWGDTDTGRRVRTSTDCRRRTYAPPWRRASRVCRRTISISTKPTTSTEMFPGRNSGRRWSY